MRRTLVMVCAAGLACGLAADALAGGPGTTGADVLKVNVGARANGLGGAYAAVGGDAEAVLYDPATLITVTAPDAVFQHYLAVEEVSYEVLGFAQPWTDLGTVGATLVWRHMPTIDNPGAPDAPVLANDGYLTLGLARALGDLIPGLGPGVNGLAVGAAVKLIFLSLREASGGSIAFDAGLYWTAPAEWPVGVTLAAALQNLGPPLTLVEEADPLPVTARGALAVVPFANDMHRVLATAEATFGSDSTARLLLGAEYGFAQTLFLRVGYTLAGADNLGGPTAGLGVAFWAGKVRARLDYSYRMTLWNGLDTVDGNHLISVGASF